MDGIGSASVPFSQFDSVLENLRRGWLLHRSSAPPTAATVTVTAGAAPGEAVVVVNPSVPEWGGAAAAPSRPAAAAAAAGSVMLSLQSHLALSPEGLIEVRERCCLTKRRSLTFAQHVKWVRLPMPSPCVCCSCLELGTLAEGRVVEAPMDALHSGSLMAALKPAMLARAPARGPPPATLTACAPQWNCQCPKRTLSLDSDFATVTSQPSACSCTGTTTLFRTEDVPWVYSERSATLWCQGLSSLALTLGLIAASGVYFGLAQNWLGLLGLLAAPVLIALLSCLGIVSFASIASLCCTFTVVTLGTPGSAASEGAGGVRPSNTPLLLCCCLLCPPCALLMLLRPLLGGKAGGVARLYNCEQQNAAQSKAFVAAARRHLTAAHLACRRAAAAGASGEGK